MLRSAWKTVFWKPTRIFLVERVTIKNTYLGASLLKITIQMDGFLTSHISRKDDIKEFSCKRIKEMRKFLEKIYSQHKINEIENTSLREIVIFILTSFQTDSNDYTI